ncbi:hypothetical protein [Maridesulfovibrio ferrireducens]|uniref:hypothetical protein n=1 Tax=Maridesulfovibrio ferrireducens TaxID=246191 RepID=UPI001A344526|nr:hypothetical protein [Maridesulfovibrio ferrireducens]MBI9110266.1 hypothetical protein [Maridesulfovibrio ferrireducens]
METPLQLEQVRDELIAMKIAYPHCGFTGTTIMAIAPLYLRDFETEGMSAKDFFEACSLARRNNKMFPTVGDIVKAHRELMAGARVPRNRPSLPPPPITDEQVAKAKANIKRIMDMVKNVKRVPKCRTYATR